MKAKLFLALAVLSAPALASAEGGLNGPFVGGYLGNVDGSDSGKEIDTGAPSGWTQKTSPSGAIYGLSGGYNWVLGNNLVLGVEADYETRSADDKSRQKDIGGVTGGLFVKTELGAAYSLRAKFGYAFNAKTTLAYVTAGYAAADIKRTFTDASFGSATDSGWQGSTTVGLGVEQLFKDHISVRVEYRYTDYGDTNINVSSIYPPGVNLIEKQTYDEQSLRIGVAYKF